MQPQPVQIIPPEIEDLRCELIHDEKQNIKPDFEFKLILIGNSGVGKSCIVSRATKNEFRPMHKVTIGVEFGSYLTEIEGKKIKLSIWDTAGDEAYRSVTRIFYKGAQAILFVFDISDQSSFHSLSDWISEAKEFTDLEAVNVLVGNQSDRIYEREVSWDDVSNFALEKNMKYKIETSAKTGENVQTLFTTVSKMLYLQKKQTYLKEKEETKRLQLESPHDENKKKNGGCHC